eukprot:TRINITY_DN11803_c2_g1_i1.p1 TRINITY_DN11803_c2_g1~~TRINITY_DN11803_c2_g1_i1.p1  ORF type:complete len:150 (+),score=21.89 TRINITY_DN11803_c2_g1_i1:53-451(+)
MPVFKDEAGRVRKVHSGYEGSKYQELGTVRSFRWQRTAKIVFCGGLFTYGYLTIAALLEENSAIAVREQRRKMLLEKQEANPEVFSNALSRGLITSSTGGSTQVPLEENTEEKVLKDDLNLKYRERVARLSQ